MRKSVKLSRLIRVMSCQYEAYVIVVMPITHQRQAILEAHATQLIHWRLPLLTGGRYNGREVFSYHKAGALNKRSHSACAMAACIMKTKIV